MKIGARVILGCLIIALMVGVGGYISINVSQKALQKSIGERSVTLAQERMNRIDRNIYDKIEGFVGYSNYPMSQEAIIESNKEFEKLGNIQDYINEKDSEWVTAPKEEVTPFMQELISNKLSEELREKIRFYEDEYGYRVFGEIFVTNKYGANVAQTGKTTDYYQADEEWWQKAKEDGLYVEDISYDESTGIYSIAVGIRINDEDGNFLGGGKAVLNIEYVINIVNEIYATRTYESGQFKLVNKDEKIIYSTEGLKFFENLPSRILSLLKEKQGEGVNYFIAKGDMPEEGEELFAYAHSKGYKEFKGLGWILIVEYKTKEIFAPIVELQKNILIILLAVIVFTIIIGIFFSRSISNPIIKLKESADKISKGNLAEPIAVKSKDEVEELAVSFDDMRYSLKMVIDEYEKMKGNEELIDELKTAKEQLELSEIRYKTIFECARDGILAAEAKTKKFLFANPQMCKMTGYREEELLKLSVDDIHPKKDLPYVIGQFDKQLKGEIIIAKDIPVLRKDKKVIYCDVNSVPVKVGEYGLLLGFFRDVTESRKRTEQLERFAKLSVGREEKMIELKKRVEELEKELKRRK